MKVCQYCGMQLEDVSQFCIRCGRVSSSVPPPEATAPAPNYFAPPIPPLNITKPPIAKTSLFEAVNFFHPIIHSANTGGFFRIVAAVLFCCIGLLILGEMIYRFFDVIGDIKDVWMFFSLMLLLAAAFLAFQVWTYWAKTIYDDTNSEYKINLIISSLLKAFGGSIFFYLITQGIIVCIGLWVKSEASYMLKGSIQKVVFDIFPNLGFDSIFLFGFFYLLLSGIIAYLFLVVTYFLGDQVSVLFDIAKNTKDLRNKK